MQRLFATLALFGYLLGGMLLPAMHWHGMPGDDQHTATCESTTACEHHQALACCPAEGPLADSAESLRVATPQGHVCDGSCLLCQLSSQVYVAKGSASSVLLAGHAASWKPPHRQLPPISQRRTAGYLRGPPAFVS